MHINLTRKSDNNYYGIIQFRGAQCSLVSKFLQVRGDVILLVNYLRSLRKVTLTWFLQATDRVTFHTIRKGNSIFFGCKLHLSNLSCKHFDASSNCCSVTSLHKIIRNLILKPPDQINHTENKSG